MNKQSLQDPAESALFWDIYAVWTLLEILFPLPHATRHSSVVGDLLQWLDLCFSGT
jgi:hypothetical protein